MNSKSTSVVAEMKHQQNVQTWHEPTLYTLEKLLETRKANLLKRNDDEGKAAVKRDELLLALHEEHRITIWYAGEIVSSLKRAGKINCFGTFINFPEKDDES